MITEGSWASARAPPAKSPFLLQDCVGMKEKSRHSRGSGNPVLNLFNIQTSWMPAFAGMTNYDTISSWERVGVMGIQDFSIP
jgi:hypothetical protein